MDICMLTPSERTDLQVLMGEFETMKRKLLAFLEKIEEEWQQEVAEAPVPKKKTERTDLPKQRLQILSEWIGHLDEQCVQLEDMEEIVPRDPKPPVIKPQDKAYNIENYTLPPAKREELKTLIAAYNEECTKLLTTLKDIHQEWEEHYDAEPVKCTKPDAEAEIRRRVNLIDDWMSDVEPIEKLDIDDLDDYVQ
jgi:hypothetical protein